MQQISQQGIAVAALLERARFPAEALEGEHHLAPLVPFLRFIDLVAAELGLAGLGLRLGLREDWADWSPACADLRLSCPLGTVVRRSARSLNHPWTGAGYWLDLVEQTRLFIAVTLPDRMASLSTAAQAAGLSQRSLQRAFRARQVSFGHLLDDVRVEHALQRLREPDGSIGDVALELGYSNPSNFTRAFRRRLGCAPSIWRRSALRSEGAAARAGYHAMPGGAPGARSPRWRAPSVSKAEAHQN